MNIITPPHIISTKIQYTPAAANRKRSVDRNIPKIRESISGLRIALGRFISEQSAFLYFAMESWDSIGEIAK